MKVSKVRVTRVALCAIAVLIIAPSGFLHPQNNNWRGKVDSSWNNPANWSQGVPTSSSSVIISDSGFAPVVPPPGSDTAKTGNLKIQQGALLSFDPNPDPGILVVYGTGQLLNQGTVNLGDGRIIFKNSISFQNGGTFDAGSGTLDFQGVVWNNASGSNFIPGTSTVTFSGAQPETLLGNISFYNVQFENTSGSISLSGNITITNSVIVDSGVSVTLSSGSLTLTSTATLEMSSGSSLNIQGAFNNSGTITGSGTISSTKPLIQSLVALSTTAIDITFSEAVDLTSSQTTSNYTVTKSISVSSATRDASNHALVHLTVSTMYQDTVYTMTINNVLDETATDTIAVNTQRQFTYPPEALPVQLVSFSARANRLAAELLWSTESEVNNFGFEIERRSVGSNNWTKVGFVIGSGTSTSAREYSHVDANVPSGRYAYRIKQIDNDGTFQYYGNAEVEIGLAAKEFRLESNYPNPFN
ncbi:MAG: hypothetical protein HY562_01075, partial [Ignavibacteriales bacterium]|nr:hypothetical protein [Ignavibacteriales bacterium]